MNIDLVQDNSVAFSGCDHEILTFACSMVFSGSWLDYSAIPPSFHCLNTLIVLSLSFGCLNGMKPLSPGFNWMRRRMSSMLVFTFS
jgi:hypothetical protein